MAETFHAANRGENLTCIFVNNACYGMTGGQMAPTTLIGQKTATTPWGRNSDSKEGWPIKFSEILATLPGVSFAARSAISGPKGVINARNYIRKAFMNQLENKCFSIVENLSPCPTVWQKRPIEAIKWIDEEMVKTFPLGVIKDIEARK
jgi:2-oxoglutarate ferredoxin oxidoreductase subunit beta